MFDPAFDESSSNIVKMNKKSITILHYYIEEYFSFRYGKGDDERREQRT